MNTTKSKQDINALIAAEKAITNRSILLSFAAVCLMGLVGCATRAPNIQNGLQGETITAATGTPQSHAVGGTFAVPFVATVTKDGAPAIGIVVTFNSPSTGATGKFVDTGTNSTTAQTDANGLATAAAFVANAVVGTYTVTASAPSAQGQASFSLTNTTGPPAGILLASGNSQTASINAPFALPLSAKVVDSAQNPVQFAAVVFTAPTTGPSGSFSDSGTNTTSATTDASGIAISGAFVANAIAGSVTVLASVDGATGPATFSLTNLAGAATRITATSGTPQKAAVGTVFSAPLVATVFDGSSNPVSGVAVTFSAPASAASGTFANGTASDTETTDTNGAATSSAFSANGTTGSYTVTATIPGGASPADFSLANTPPFHTYVFYLSGEEYTTAFYALVGAVQIDAGGHVLGGEQDYNDGGFGISSPEPSGDLITGGSLNVSSSTGQGTLTLITDNPNLGVSGTETLAVQFVNTNHAMISQFDGTATSSGSLDIQTLPSELSGGFAFTLTGVDPNFLPVTFGGVFTISNGTNIQTGLFDTNDFGTVTTGASLSGTLSKPDSYGRGSINSTLNYTDLVGSPAPITLNYYIVGPEALRLIDVDSLFNGAASSDTAVGSAFGQGPNAATASNNSLGTSVFGLVGNSFDQVAAAGMFSTTASDGSFSGVADDSELAYGIQLPESPISGSYSIANNGYGSMTISSGSLGDFNLLGIYMTDPNLNLTDPNNSTSGVGGALVADLDPFLSGAVGFVLPQTDTSITNFTNAYAFGGQAFAFLYGSGEFDFVGQRSAGSKVHPGVGLLSDPFFVFGANTTNSNVKFSGTPQPDPSYPGRYSMTEFNPTPNPLRIIINGTAANFDVGIYQANPGQLFWLNGDSGSSFLALFEQQGSLAGIPTAGAAALEMKPAKARAVTSSGNRLRANLRGSIHR